MRPSPHLRRMPHWLTAIAAFLLGMVAGYLLWTGGWHVPSGANDDPVGNRPLRERGYTYVSPLLACASTDNKEFEEFRPLERKLTVRIAEHVTAGEARRISLYFRELDSGHWIGINEAEKFSPASLFKVPILIAYYNLSRGHPDVFTRRLAYDGHDPTEQSGIEPTESLTPGQSYTVQELIEKMIIHSDNKSANLLLGAIDQNSLAEVFSDLDIPQPDGRDTGDVVSVKTYGFFFRILYNATYLTRSASERAMELLTKTAFQDGLVAGVPPDIVVAHKFGDRRALGPNGQSKWQLHDCGVIYLPGNPYLLCVMTEGAEARKLTAAITDISRLVYENMAAPRR